MTRWHSLYLSSEQSQTLIAAIHSYFETHHYKIYHPFGALPGMSYPDTIKTFIAPVDAGWTRLLLDGDTDSGKIDSLCNHLSNTCDCLSVSLDGNIGQIHAYHNAQLLDLPDWSNSYLARNELQKLTRILNAESFNLPEIGAGQIGDVPIEALPDDIQAMAREVNVKKANKLFEKLSNKLLKAAGRNDARQLINQGVNWNSQGGQHIRSVMDCLPMPEKWREPDFSTLRTAYAVRSRQEEGLNSLYPGDEDALNAIPDALDYIPVYGGKIEA